MFTGIVTDMGRVADISDDSADRRLRIGCSYDVEKFDIGASIACDGVCLTVVDKGSIANDGGYYFDVVASPHTQRVTTVGDWVVGRKVNLEQALRLGDELGGHIVTGHVDVIAHVVDKVGAGGGVSSDSDSISFFIEYPVEIAPYIAERGSVTLNGVSLTVASVDDSRLADGKGVFEVALIPHTLEVTTWGDIEIGDRINLEVDVLARYVRRMNEVESVLK